MTACFPYSSSQEPQKKMAKYLDFVNNHTNHEENFDYSKNPNKNRYDASNLRNIFKKMNFNCNKNTTVIIHTIVFSSENSFF